MFSASISDAILPIKNRLEQLESCGVDLRVYVEEGIRVLECESADREFEFAEVARAGQRRISRLRLVGFTFGALVDEWFFWFAPVVEHSFVESFDMAEHPERVLPGAW
jgi:hypothetical protein